MTLAIPPADPLAAPPPRRLLLDHAPGPLGEILLLTDEAGRLRALDFADYEARMHRLLHRQYRAPPAPEAGAAPAAIRRALADYFDGRLDALSDLPLAAGGTPFQRRVWQALTAIPPGRTESYGALAARLGMARGFRAVGLANGANPLGIVLPCHRVIGANGRLTGYGGGIERKRWLLRHEGAAFADPHPA